MAFIEPHGFGDTTWQASQPLSINMDPHWWTSFGDWYKAAHGNDVPQAMYFPFWSAGDDGITEDAATEWTETQVPGRSEAFQTWNGMANKSVNLTLSAVAESGANTGGADWSPSANNWTADTHSSGAKLLTPRNINAMGRWMEWLKQPVMDPATKLNYSPPVLILQIGKLLVMRCILVDCQVIWRPPFEPETLFAAQVEIPCQFRAVRAPAGTAYTPSLVPPDFNKHLTFPG